MCRLVLVGIPGLCMPNCIQHKERINAGNAVIQCRRVKFLCKIFQPSVASFCCMQIMPGYDKLRSIHKPLTIYALLHALGWGLSIFLRQLGYSPINQDGLTFWIWKPAKINKATKGSTITGAGASSPAPLVFFQGLGPLLPTFVSDIRKVGGGRTVILLQASFQYLKARLAVMVLFNNEFRFK